MFCSECGAQASGRFCWRCGARVTGGDQPASSSATAAAVAPGHSHAPVADWSQETRYDALLSIPAVRARIAACAEGSDRPMSADQFLSLADKLAGPLLGMPVSFAAIAEVAEPLGKRLGVHTGKQREESFSQPAGEVLVAVLCALAHEAISITAVHQADDGCVLEVKVPSDFRAWGAKALVTVTRRPEGTLVQVAVTVSGQLFDWGRSRGVLEGLFAAIAEQLSQSTSATS